MKPQKPYNISIKILLIKYENVRKSVWFFNNILKAAEYFTYGQTH